MIHPRSALGGILAAALTFTSLVMTSPRAPAGFPDVPRDHWAADAVNKLAEAGILKGYPSGPAQRAGDAGFAGDKPVTRYELAVTLWRFVQYLERADRQRKGDRGVPGREAVKRLVSAGYLLKNTPLARDGDKRVTANQLADALAQIVVRMTERETPVTPDSLRAPAPEAPRHAPGTLRN